MPQNTKLDDQNIQIGMRLLGNEESVLREILHEFGPKIIGFLRKKYKGVLNLEDIEDIISIAIFRLWQARESYDESKGSVKAWFFKIAINVAKDVLKLGWQQAKKLEVNSELCDFGMSLPTKTNINSLDDKEIIGKDDKKIEQLRKIIESLPEVQKSIVLADAYAEDDKADVEFLADKLNIPIGTVRVYRKRAMDKIKCEFRKIGYSIP